MFWRDDCIGACRIWTRGGCTVVCRQVPFAGPESKQPYHRIRGEYIVNLACLTAQSNNFGTDITEETRRNQQENTMDIFAKCPHCNMLVVINRNEVNCRIFRHGTFKSTMQQIDPHLPKAECDKLVIQGEIYGCGKPFKLLDTDQAIKCEYI